MRILALGPLTAAVVCEVAVAVLNGGPLQLPCALPTVTSSTSPIAVFVSGARQAIALHKGIANGKPQANVASQLRRAFNDVSMMRQSYARAQAQRRTYPKAAGSNPTGPAFLADKKGNGRGAFQHFATDEAAAPGRFLPALNWPLKRGVLEAPVAGSGHETSRAFRNRERRPPT